jgi:DNA-binding CsgD family transcriptional regulator
MDERCNGWAAMLAATLPGAPSTEAQRALIAAALNAAMECARREALADAPAPYERDAVMAGLSPRERELVDALCTGERVTAVSKRMGVSRHTARNHLKRAFRKLGMHSQNEMIAKLGARHA